MQTFNQAQTFAIGFIPSWRSLPQWSAIAEQGFILQDVYQLWRACLTCPRVCIVELLLGL